MLSDDDLARMRRNANHVKRWKWVGFSGDANPGEAATDVLALLDELAEARAEGAAAAGFLNDLGTYAPPRPRRVL